MVVDRYSTLVPSSSAVILVSVECEVVEVKACSFLILKHVVSSLASIVNASIDGSKNVAIRIGDLELDHMSSKVILNDELERRNVVLAIKTDLNDLAHLDSLVLLRESFQKVAPFLLDGLDNILLHLLQARIRLPRVSSASCSEHSLLKVHISKQVCS